MTYQWGYYISVETEISVGTVDITDGIIIWGMMTSLMTSSGENHDITDDIITSGTEKHQTDRASSFRRREIGTIL